MKTGTLATKLMLAAIFLTVLVYFGVNVAAYFIDPYATAIAYSFTGEQAVTVSGYTVRDEEILTGGGELVYFSRGEGEKVSAGGTVALIYPSADALSNANQLRALEQQLEQLLYARSLISGAQTSVRLDEEIQDALVSLHTALAGNSLPAAEEAGKTLRAGLLKRNYAYSGTGDLEAAIANLQGQISALSAAADPGTTRVSAPKPGLFSSLTDGYETVLLPENIKTMTPEDFRKITPEDAAGVGKMIYGSEWSYVALMRVADIGKLQVGDTVRLRFQTGLDQDLTMRVSYMSSEKDGQRVVSFTSDRYLNLTTLLRHQNAQIILNSEAGIRVPRSAVRIYSETVTNEDGSKTSVKTPVVYSLWGIYAKRKPVDIVWQEDDYLLVRPAAGVSEERRLRAGDEVITAADELYDGKVVAQ